MLKKKCVHNRIEYFCKDCKGKGICTHNRRKARCIECNGNQICGHNKFKSFCKECKGSQICEHNKVKTICKECNGILICEHKRIKIRCKECKGSQICEHNRVKYICKECNGNQICEHNREKYQCKDCGGSQICIHNRIKSKCKECKGASICIHNKHKTYCKECGGSSLCKSSWCEIKANPKYEYYCLRCFIHLFPYRPNTKNYKTKEKTTVDYILEKYPDFTWITDRKIQDGCSRKRPDLLLDLGYQVIIVEIDENQHESYDCSCENKRLMLLSQDVSHRPIIFIRFNPDEYNTKDGKVTSCWANNKLGVCTVKKSKEKEWSKRLEALKNQIEYWTKPENITNKTIEIIELFYDSN